MIKMHPFSAVVLKLWIQTIPCARFSEKFGNLQTAVQNETRWMWWDFFFFKRTTLTHQRSYKITLRHAHLHDYSILMNAAKSINLSYLVSPPVVPTLLAWGVRCEDLEGDTTPTVHWKRWVSYTHGGGKPPERAHADGVSLQRAWGGREGAGGGVG